MIGANVLLDVLARIYDNMASAYETRFKRSSHYLANLGILYKTLSGKTSKANSRSKMLTIKISHMKLLDLGAGTRRINEREELTLRSNN